MVIKTLCENTSSRDDIGCEHGLSLYIEFNGKKIMVDTGQTDLFYDNSKKMDVDVSDVDYLVLSHGHYDHGGGIKKFLEVNKKAGVFIHRLAFNDYYAKRSSGNTEYIGIDKKLEKSKRIVKTDGNFNIDENIKLFSCTEHIYPLPVSNKGLLEEINGEMTEDRFLHEQNTVIRDNDKTVLITGCSHNGIVNILRQFHKLEGKYPDVVIGGFHLMRRSADNNEDCGYIDKLGELLIETGSKYYTCHCTGIRAYERLKKIMGDKIEYLSAGTVKVI